MATNQYQEGDVLTYTNAGSAILSGAVVLMNSLVGVALDDIAATTGTGPVQVSGVFLLAAASGAWSQGQDVYWDAGNSVFTTASTGNTLAGTAAYAKTTSATTGYVLLNKHS